MKTLLHALGCIFIPSLCLADEPPPNWAPPEVHDGVANLIGYNDKEFAAVRLLCRIRSGVAPTKTKYMPVITDQGVEAARLYLLNERFGFSSSDEFKRRRLIQQLDTMLKNNDEPFRTIDGVTHVKVDLTEHVINSYDFDKGGYPFRPEFRGGLTTHTSLYDESRGLGFESIKLNLLPIEPDLAERWKKEGGTVTGLARVGKGFTLRQKIPAVRSECEKIEFRTRDGELLKEITLPVSGRDLDKDETIEDITDPKNFAVDGAEEKSASDSKSKGGATTLVTVLLLLGIGWWAMKFRSSKKAAAR